MINVKVRIHSSKSNSLGRLLLKSNSQSNSFWKNTNTPSLIIQRTNRWLNSLKKIIADWMSSWTESRLRNDISIIYLKRSKFSDIIISCSDGELSSFKSLQGIRWGGHWRTTFGRLFLGYNDKYLERQDQLFGWLSFRLQFFTDIGPFWELGSHFGKRICPKRQGYSGLASDQEL